MHIDQASQFATWFWPAFVVRDDLIFLEHIRYRADDCKRRLYDRTSIESSLNHVHILDIFEHEASVDTEPFWVTDHPHFQVACQLGRTLAKSWAHKLSLDFPDRKLRVYYTRDDNPIVRFHQVHDGEPPWLDGQQSAGTDADAVLVIKVGSR